MNKLKIDKIISQIEPDCDNKNRRAYRAVLTAINGPFTDEDHAVKFMCEFWNDHSQEFVGMIYRLTDNKVFQTGKKLEFLDSEIYSEGLGLVLGATIAMGYMERAKS